MNDTLSYCQAAKHLNVAPRTVAKWIDHGRLQATGERNAWRIDVQVFKAFCDEYGLREYVPESL